MEEQEILVRYLLIKKSKLEARIFYLATQPTQNILDVDATNYINILKKEAAVLCAISFDQQSKFSNTELNITLFQKRANLFLLQMFISTNKFQDLFVTFNKSWSHFVQQLGPNVIEKSILFINLHSFLGSITSYPMLQKYIWKHKKLWKPLMNYFMKILMDKHLKTNDQMVYSTILRLFNGLRYKTKYHVQYLLDNGLNECIIHISKKCWKQNKKEIIKYYNTSNNDQDLFYRKLEQNRPLYQIFTVFSYIFKEFTFVRGHGIMPCMCEWKSCVFTLQDHSYFTELLSDHMRCEWLFRRYILKTIFSIKSLSFSPLGNYAKLCEWIRCKQTNKSTKLYQCKGCKLVTYCSKSHQKKHWKLIHSTQCLRK